jgi:hypothetical protein
MLFILFVDNLSLAASALENGSEVYLGSGGVAGVGAECAADARRPVAQKAHNNFNILQFTILITHHYHSLLALILPCPAQQHLFGKSELGHH